MVLSRIFQDEINASQAKKKAISSAVKYKPAPVPKKKTTSAPNVRVTPKDFVVAAATRATQRAATAAGTPTASGRTAPTPSPAAPTPTKTNAGSTGSGSTGSSTGAAKSRADVRETKPVTPKARLNLDEISAALDAISAIFDLQEGELTAEQAAAKQAYDFLRSSLLKSRDEAIEQTRDVAAGRGILRSGLYLNRAAEIGDEAATQVAQAQAQKDARVRAITDKANALAAQEAAERRAKATELAREQVGYNEDIAAALELV